MLGEKECRAIRPDAQGFDAVAIETVPRWKDSELSGSEWRISASIKFFRKGILCHEEHVRNVETACNLLSWFHARALDDGKGYFGGEKGTCDQEGCSQPGITKLYQKKEYCRSGHASELHRPTYRLFCEKHRRRGDCGLDDSDTNYEERT